MKLTLGSWPEVESTSGSKASCGGKTPTSSGNKLRYRQLLARRMKLCEVVMDRKRVVEVAVESNGGLVPVGIMNLDQALALPDEIDAKISHPEEAAGPADLFVDRRELISKARRSS